jgi:hypothetical protein
MDRRKRYKLPDGSYFIEVRPDVYHLFNAFGRFVSELTAEVVSLGENQQEAADHDKPRKG